MSETTNVNTVSVTRRSDSPIAWWAHVIAAFAFLAFQYFMNVFIPRQPNPPPRGFCAFIGIVAGGVIWAWILLVGFVHNDAEKRGMNKWAWTFVVLLVPNALGFVLYLLTRKQLLVECDQCHNFIQPTYRFCPKCAAPRLAACGHCNTPIQPGDQYCNNCGRMLHEPLK